LAEATVVHSMDADAVVVGVDGAVGAVAIPIATPASGVPNIVQQREHTISFLSEKHWPHGLQARLLESVERYPIRYFICDDSGSMLTNDGKKVVGDGSKAKTVCCTRWSELRTAMSFHVHLADQLQATSQFRLLNSSAPITIGDGAADGAAKVQQLLQLFELSPSGSTPLCRHIHEVTTEIRRNANELRRNGQKACVIIATDGESTDGNLLEAMRSLQSLPVWVVVRLCTDEPYIVNYYNRIEKDLELEMDIIDDLCGEAKEVRIHNEWLNYAEPLHRIREFGIYMKECDLIDESRLSLEQKRVLCWVILGGPLNEYPHPHEDWGAFVSFIQKKNEENGRVWSPAKERFEYWINTAMLSHINYQTPWVWVIAVIVLLFSSAYMYGS